MSFTTEAAVNGRPAVRWDSPANSSARTGSGTVRNSFFLQMSRAAQEAEQAEDSGQPDLKTGYDRLTAQSRELLARLKEAAAVWDDPDLQEMPEGVTKDEWKALRRDMKDAGLISSTDYFRSDPDVVIVGYTDPNDGLVAYPPFQDCAASAETGPGETLCASGSTGWLSRLGAEDWTGNPFQFLDQWLQTMRRWQYDLEQMVRPNGVKYDTSHLVRQMEDRQKVTGLVKDLMNLV